MAEVIFKYKGTDTLIQCLIEDKLKDICQKFCIKTQNNINDVVFIYGGEIINFDLEFNQAANQIDKKNLKMNVLVSDKNSYNTNENINLIKSKDILFPKCGEICLIDFKDYKVILNNCKNGDENIISFNEFENTQSIDENKIICNICNTNTKSKAYNKKFYICGNCNKNLCPLCKENHNKDHIIIDYENKNYFCHKHNEQFVSYCEQCKINLCMQCQLAHDKSHKIISYLNIIPNMDNIKNKIKELKDIIDRFSNNIDDLINSVINIKTNLEKYYTINNNILNNYNVKNRNYEILNNLNNIDNINNIIINDLKNIINEKNIANKFYKIYSLNIKKNNNEIKTTNQIKNKDLQTEIKNNEIKNNQIKEKDIQKVIKNNEENKDTETII